MTSCGTIAIDPVPAEKERTAADKIVVGSLGKIGNRYILNAKLLNVVTGEAVSSAYEIFKSIEALVDGSEAVAGELIGD